MKKKLCSVGQIVILAGIVVFFAQDAYTGKMKLDDFSSYGGTVGGVLSGDQDKSKEDIDANEARERENAEYELRLERQHKLLEGLKKGKNFDEISKLTEYGFVVTENSLSDLEANLGSSATSVTKVDLFERKNLNAALVCALKFVLDENADSNFIIGEYNLPGNIKKNPGLEQAITELSDYMAKSHDLSEADEQVNILERLQEIRMFLKNDKDITERDAFARFISGMVKLYQVCIARRVATQILESSRVVAENTLQKTTRTQSATVGVKGNIEGAVTVGATSTTHLDEGAADTSFYTVSLGGGARLSVGADVGVVSAEAGASIDVTESAIFYSLEQLLDSGKLSVGVLTSKDIKKISRARRAMQKREKELLSMFGSAVEGYLKMISVVPVSVYIEWPNLSKAAPAERAVAVSKALDASVSVLSSVGFSVKTSKEVKTYERPTGYLTLIMDDCFPSEGLKARDISKFVGEIYDFSLNYGGKSDENILPTLLGEIRGYNNALEAIAENKSSKEASQNKHDIESRWLPKKRGLTSEGRIGVLKSMIVTCAILRETATKEREIELFKQLYSELERLSKLQEFSKTKSKRDGSFTTKTVADNSAISGGVKVTLPALGETSVDIVRSSLKGNPFQEGNGDFMELKCTLPMSVAGVIGLNTIQSKLRGMSDKLGVKNPNQSPSDMVNALFVAQDGLNLFASNTSIPFVSDTVSKVPVGTSMLSLMMKRIDAAEPSGFTRPLPGQEKAIFKDKNRWVIQYAQSMACSSKDVGVNVKMFNVGFSSAIGKRERIIGTNTLTYITARYNAWALGLKDKAKAANAVNTPWEAFKAEQAGQFAKLFSNMADENSNVRYELQNIYNAIMDNAMKTDSKTRRKIDSRESLECTAIFEKFLDACVMIAEVQEHDLPQAYEEAIGLFDKVIELNHRYNFLPDYERAYAVKKN